MRVITLTVDTGHGDGLATSVYTSEAEAIRSLRANYFADDVDAPESDADLIAWTTEHGGLEIHFEEHEVGPRNVACLDADVLREDWVDRPGLTDEQRTALNALSDEVITAALDEATGEFFWSVFDDVRGDATAYLLADLNKEET